jgi:hypothetical protein
MATGAGRPNAGVTNYGKPGSAAGTPVIDGGMNTSVAGIRTAIGMTAITIATTTTTELSSFRKMALESDGYFAPVVSPSVVGLASRIGEVSRGNQDC